MKKKYILLPIIELFIFLFAVAQEPLFTVLPGTEHIIKTGTVVSLKGLVLNPTKDFSLTGKSIIRQTTATNTTINPNIADYYSFNGTTNPFTGSLVFNYSDADLNGLNEANLNLNIYGTSKWDFQVGGAINTIDNYTQNIITGISFKELTLGNCKTTQVMATNSIQSICNNMSIANIAITDAKNVTGSTFSWTRSNNSNITGISSSGTGSTISGKLTNNTNIPQITEFLITANRNNGCASTTVATVTVNPSLLIIRQPSSTALLLPTQTATFELATSGLVTSYQWQQLSNSKNASWANITNGGIYGGAFTSKLVVSNVSLGMDGNKYRCIVSGQCSQSIISLDATLSVKAICTIVNISKYDYINLMDKNNKTISIEVYPNPTVGPINLVANNFDIGKAVIRIFDEMQNLTFVKEVEILNSRQTFTLNINQNYRGIYVLQLRQANQVKSLLIFKN